MKTVPVAAGTPGGEKASWGGKMVLMAKEGTINMTSQSVGLGDAYDKMVDDSMRLTWSGMYMHAAPWNNANFGVKNNSSGCVGMSKADADCDLRPGAGRRPRGGHGPAAPRARRNSATATASGT